MPLRDDPQWWRSAVVYQVYPRSFADADGDGTGDVLGIIDRLPYLAELGIDAIWVSPWYPSPLADGGYDVSDYRGILPEFGTLEQADEFVATAHELGMRVLIDLVPNHSSDEHPWFQQALAAKPGSAERARYLFRPGRGVDGSEPPNNWPAMFGGGAWQRTTDPDGSPGEWYLHLFDPKQPDWNWDNPAVADEFDDILRFWFDRGIDGFRIDVANSMAKAPGLPDLELDPATGRPAGNPLTGSPFMNQPHVHDILRRWRTVADSYADSDLGARVFVSEAWVTPASELAKYIRPDELHTTFNFDALMCEWTAASQRHVIDLTLRETGAVGAPPTWVLANHDTTRVVTRYGRPVTGARFTEQGMDFGAFAGVGSVPEGTTDVALGRRRARAAVLLEMALPGGAYVYQGDELGLEEVEDLPEELLQDPTWERSGHVVRGRDGCRVPIPWSGSAAPFGFGSADAAPWLPQPEHWADLTAEAQDADPTSHLNLYRTVLAERHRNPALGDGTLRWTEGVPDGVLAFDRDPGFRCVVNFGPTAYALPPGALVLVASGDPTASTLEVDEAVWLAI
ncbi:MAG TPA: alpha-amylase family glycosyl hydrolase [Microlunatus sp.]|nr:alpha-amylase family glycosyl hydrolase [Microlunatus sp.]